MKKGIVVFLIVGMQLLGIAGIVNATVLTFDDGSNLGINLGGNLEWTDTSGGHLWMDQYDTTGYILFQNSSTYVNDFEMNYQPWENYGSDPAYDSGWPVVIKAFDSSDSEIWSQSVDLTSTANDWTDWITIAVNTANVSYLSFGPTGAGAPYYYPSGYYPSIDNLRINENSTVPEPATLLLFGVAMIGLAGLQASKKKPFSIK